MFTCISKVLNKVEQGGVMKNENNGLADRSRFDLTCPSFVAIVPICRV